MEVFGHESKFYETSRTNEKPKGFLLSCSK